MSLFDRTIGKWMDESCKRSALIVCQKKHEFLLSVLVNSIQIIEKQVEEQNKLIENQDKKLNHSMNAK